MTAAGAPAGAAAVDQVAAGWLARLDAHPLDAAGDSGLAAWLDADPAHRVAFLRLHAAWQESDRLRVFAAGREPLAPAAPADANDDGDARRADPASPDRRAQMLEALAPRPRSRRRGRRRQALVAVLATGCAAVLAIIAIPRWRVEVAPPLPSLLTLQTAVGQVRTWTLPDGSSATLAGDSRLQLRLLPHGREVALARGEAIFDVAKDPRRPFSVAAEGYQAVAVGTRFSVRRDSSRVRVVVTEGTVRLQSPGAVGSAHPTALLPAGSVAVGQGDGVLVSHPGTDEAARLLDWRDGLLVFRDTSLADAVEEFNRYNVRKLVVGDATAGALRIGGSFRWDNAAGFARLLEAGLPVRARYFDDRIVLESR